jgi:uncharacterized protein
MLKRFLPDEHVKSVFDINIDKLMEKGIKGIITDLDNTLVEWDRPDATPELTKWFQSIQAKGINVTIVSNNSEERVKKFSDPLGISFIPTAKKPLGSSFKKALMNMKLRNDEVVVIGDQLLTDVLGGNRQNLHTILVVPVAQTDGVFTKINRTIERKLLTFMKKRGMIYWEE